MPKKSSLPRRDYFTLITESLESLDKSSKKDGLAYLVATSKPEAAIRDRLAFILQQKHKTRWAVARELSSKGKKRKTRVDIALMNEHGPEAVIQLKAQSAGKLTSSTQLRKKACRDLQKCKNHQAGHCLYLLLAALIESPWGKPFPGLDLGKVIVNALWKQKEVESVRNKAKEVIKKAFPVNAWKVKDGTIRAGEAFGASISVLYWLCEKKGA